ncbi:unnamed protein product [Clonostachys solani]|uniref:Uncharacterized protein n=1 Tax=Clonostachys solani TaxID=160281 RepID=A0A9N9W2X3_9HYPO|nr:unnamed protein product [Clonostachys solani]
MSRTPGSEDTKFIQRSVQPRDNSTNSAITAQVELTSILGELLDLIDSIGKLLTPGFFDDVNSSITNLADLLAPPFANNTRTIVGRAGTLLDDIQPLIDQFKDLDLNSLIQLIAPIVFKLSSLLDNASKLLTTDVVNRLITLITKLSDLLTADLLSDISTLITQLAPLVDVVVQLITAIISIIIG